MGGRTIREVSLADITGIELDQQPGQEFYRAADIRLLGKGGDALLTLGGIGRAEIFVRTIEKTRDARTQVEAALATINARQPA